MGTEILRPIDCLIRPVPSLHHHRWRHPNPNPNPNPKPHPKPFKKRRSRPPKSAKTGGGGNFALGQVRILKRGDSANPSPSPSSSTIVSIESLISDRLGPDPDLVAYAGSAISTSPSPRSLPLPSFSGMKAEEPAAGLVDHSTGTKDLRRLLRLD